MLTRNYRQDLCYLFDRINSKGEGFCFTRYADGERHVLQKQHLQGYDWTMVPTFTKSNELLEEAITYSADNYYLGVSCPCCDMASYEYYKTKLANNWNNVTYANMFVNGNYQTALDYLSKVSNIPIAFLGNESTNIEKLPIKITGKVALVSDNFLQKIEEKGTSGIVDILRSNTKQLYLLSAGPAAKIIAYHLFKDNPTNYYLDIGSIFDPWIKGPTRIYHHDKRWQTLMCEGL